jgi:hypothetical protein
MPNDFVLHLELTPPLKWLLDDLAAEGGFSVAEAVRRAIALLKTARDAERAGQSVAVLARDGSVVARLEGF